MVTWRQVELAMLTAGACVGVIVLGGPMVAEAAKPAPSAPPPLTATFADAGTDNIQSDGASYVGYGDNGGALDGAYINGNGGIDINLVPGVSSIDAYDRAIRFDLDELVSAAGSNVPAACQLAGQKAAYKVDFRFNVSDGRGNPLGIETMGQNGVPSVISSGGATAGYDIAAIVNFLPSDAAGGVTNFVLRFGLAPGTTISRDAANQWTLTSSATVMLQCTVNGSKGRTTTYDVGTYHMPFTLTVTRP